MTVARQLMVAVRIAVADDCDALLSLCSAFHAQHVSLCPGDYHPHLDRAALAGMILGAIADNLIPVATCGGVVVGYAWCGTIARPASALSPSARMLFIQQVFVAEPARRQGVGARLLAFIRDFAATIGAERVALDCSVSNAPALVFFEREGFVPSTLIMQASAARSAPAWALEGRE